MATLPSPPSTHLSGLARSLVQRGLLTEKDAEDIQTQARGAATHFVSQLVLGKKLGALEIAEFAAQTFGYPLLDIDAIDTGSLSMNTLDIKLMQRHRVIALYQRGNRLTVATSDPTNLQALDAVKFQTSLAIDPIVVEDPKLDKLIHHVLESNDTSLGDLGDEDIDLEFTDDEALAEKNAEASTEIDDAPVVKYIQKILLDAINAGSSDIHFEPYEKLYRIRYRTDGILYEIATPPLAIKEKIASRIKVISKMDIAEKRVPQDGRMKLVLSKNRAIDFRVSSLPTLFGEKIVMRILDPSSATLGIDALGYDPDQKEYLLHAIHRPYGMVLVTGPTGSG
ncbi:MAG TPA: type IV-A pilus assembly ATPase PilB, partial [Betaproteobacteria bacterium]|nr:type IV-A pilus assembly ATPase PilB [Betaproteobacteria bacterium]